MNSFIEVKFAAKSEPAAAAYAELISQNVDNVGYSYTASEFKYDHGNGIAGSFFNVRVIYSVESTSLNNCLVQLDSVKQGFIEDKEGVMNDVFNDLSVEVMFYADPTVLAHLPSSIPETISYLHQRVQDQDKTIEYLEDGLNKASTILAAYEKMIDLLDVRLTSLQTYIHSYIDLNAMAQVVRETAEVVDRDILNNFDKPTIH